MAVARSSSGGVAIRYVHPVLWMTSFFHKMGPREFLRGESATAETTILINDEDRQFTSRVVRCMGPKSAVYDCLV